MHINKATLHENLAFGKYGKQVKEALERVEMLIQLKDLTYDWYGTFDQLVLDVRIPNSSASRVLLFRIDDRGYIELIHILGPEAEAPIECHDHYTGVLYKRYHRLKPSKRSRKRVLSLIRKFEQLI
ncbi:gp573 [Bacillus phage G]|uniref:Gp573 n=1 Tax=Bacillus phage G TaxID=2884420 RepID=G3MAV3_9CAUD|nr:gp573 [Bacillus phage G]AEO93819.1 gp573 [Bacillus phage G]